MLISLSPRNQCQEAQGEGPLPAKANVVLNMMSGPGLMAGTSTCFSSSMQGNTLLTRLTSQLVSRTLSLIPARLIDHPGPFPAPRPCKVLHLNFRLEDRQL